VRARDLQLVSVQISYNACEAVHSVWRGTRDAAPMSAQFDTTDTANLNTIVTFASKAIGDGLKAYDQCAVSEMHIRELVSAHKCLAQLVAYFTDGYGRGLIDDEYLTEIWARQETAAALLDGIEQMRLESLGLPAGYGDPRKVAGDRYEVRRQYVSSSGIAREKVVICTNPAFGQAQLDAWEDDLRQTLEREVAA
jgi:hypothetical protein